MLGHNVLLLITNTLLSAYAFIVLLRCVFMLSRVDFYHPIVQAVVRMSQAPIAFLRPLAPIIGRLDLSAWLLALLIKVLQLVLIFLIQGGSLPDILTVVMMALIQIAIIVVYIFIFAILILAVSSWFISATQILSHPFISLVNAVVAPMLKLTRRFTPSTGIIDFSPMLAVLVLYIMLMILKSLP